MPDGSRHIERSSDGAPSLTSVYRAQSAYVWRVLRRCGVPDEDLDDAVQETFLVLFRRLPSFEGRADIRTFVYAIAVRVASTRRRSRRREARRRDRAGAQMHGSSPVDPEDALHKAEAADLVDRLLDELDSGKRTVFVLAEIEGIKVPDISRILGVNPRTVYSRLRLARERFGSALRRLEAREAGNRRVARRPRALLADAANERPPARRRKAVGAALALRVEQGAMPALPGWETLTVASGSSGWGLPLVVAAGVALVGGAWLGGGRSTSDSVASPANAVAVAEGRGDAAGVRQMGRAGSPERAGDEAGEEPAISGPRTHHAEVQAPSSGLATPSRPSSSSSTATPASVLDRARAEPSHPPSTDSSMSPSAPAAPSVDDAGTSTLVEETILLERARTALRRGRYDAALGAIDEHGRRFAEGVLVDEARSTRIRALCAAGRHAKARAFVEGLSGEPNQARWSQVLSASCESRASSTASVGDSVEPPAPK